MITLIAAMAENHVIGKEGIMPWTIPSELKRFKELTLNNTIIMGRKTYESIGKPLPNRKTIVISKTKDVSCENCTTVESLEEALNMVKDEEEVFIAGGGEIYKQSLPYADKIHLTIIHKNFEGDTYFPKFNNQDFCTTYKKRIEEKIPYTYYTFERKF
ncbi:dihydrofolate reductase [Anaeromicrobium sediminis]|uniref:Dihydrofolate reductase n=1 Tax=Anaeromicrobium sediminis TaxID=1478221 RepID=A0A267M9H8_9FIRM|nr:dihydrofolate reductase [Anaeromicrobium sediminis]